MPEEPTFQPEEIALLYRVARGLLVERDYGELLAGLLDATIELFGAERGFVLIRDSQPGTGGACFRAAVARNYRADRLSEAEQQVSSSISSAALEQGKALLIDDAASSEFGANPSVGRLGLRSVLCAPLVASAEAFALVWLENRGVASRFTEQHRALLEEICALAGPRLRSAVAVEDARKRARELEATVGGADGILTADEGMAALLETVRQVAPTDLPVLIQGETGTGKELIARALYRQSARAQGPFVVLNCAAIPATLIESELFGHVRGAFTGANADRAGLIASANRGTLFLDEIGEMPAELQPRLLRVLQSGEFSRLGSARAETADVRFVAATNRDLEREIEAGRFRSDLFYRLSAITLKVPPLRERVHDVYLLADYFLRAYAARWGREAPRLGDECMQVLAAHPWPGNVRELESEMARLAAVMPPGAVAGPDALNDRMARSRAAALSGPQAASGATSIDAAQELPVMSLAEMEKRLLASVLKATGGNRTRAADLLGITREGLRTKMQRLGL